MQGREAEPQGKVVPIRIVSLDQCDFPITTPVFQLFLAPDGARHVAMQFLEYQSFDLVAGGEAAKHPSAMLCNAAHEVAGDPDIECAKAIAGHDIGAGLAVFMHDLL